MRFKWTKEQRMMALSTAIIALYGAQAALAQQFVPYSHNPNPGYMQYQANTPPAYTHQAYTPQNVMLPHQAPPQYTAMAPQGSGTRTVSPALTPPVETVVPGPVQNSVPAGQIVQSAPVQSYSAAPAANCNCQTGNTFQSYESYAGGCASGSCGNYNTFNSGCGYGVGAPYGGCNTGCNTGCSTGCDTGCGYLGAGNCGRGCGRQWFGGFYGLYMQRVGNDWVPLAFSTPTGNAPPYYPTDTEYVMNLQNFTETEHAGAEIRLGATFGGRRANGCGCGPRLAWEVAYWGLIEEDESSTVTDLSTDANRLYGMIDYRGLEWDPTGGGTYRPANHYVDYGPPTSDYTNGGALDEIQVRSFTARNTFSMQNIEVNLLRLPVLAGGCNTGCCGSGCGSSRYSVTSLAGFRYIRLDEDFMFRSDVENMTTPANYTFRHDIDVDSHLYGAQLGCNGLYHCGRSGRWALHCNTAVGVFNNHSEVWNRIENARYANGTNAAFNLRYEDDNISVLGELRAGASYQYSCNWRLFGGYRLLGLTGVALAFDQIPQPAHITPAQTSYVDSTGSIFLHGIQAGVECTY